jgi:hypothetical protein
VIKGPQLPKKIRALASYRDYMFASYGSDIAVFKRTDLVRKFLSSQQLNFLLTIMLVILVTLNVHAAC